MTNFSTCNLDCVHFSRCRQPLCSSKGNKMNNFGIILVRAAEWSVFTLNGTPGLSAGSVESSKERIPSVSRLQFARISDYLQASEALWLLFVGISFKWHHQRHLIRTSVPIPCHGQFQPRFFHLFKHLEGRGSARKR